MKRFEIPQDLNERFEVLAATGDQMSLEDLAAATEALLADFIKLMPWHKRLKISIRMKLINAEHWFWRTLLAHRGRGMR